MLLNRVGESAAAPGLGAITLGGALTALKSAIAGGIQSGAPGYKFLIYQDATHWEETRCTYSAGVLTRVKQYSSTNGGAAVDFTGTVNVYVAATAEDFGPGAGVMKTAVTTGAADLYAATFRPPLKEYLSGQEFVVQFHTANLTTTPVLDCDTLGNKTLKSRSGGALAIGALGTGERHILSFDGTDLRVLSWQDTSSLVTPAATETVAGKAELATATEAFTGTDTDRIVTPAGAARWHRRGADIASSANITLPADGGTVFAITGTTTIETISVRALGERVLFIVLAGFTISHDAGKIVARGGLNLQTATGDMVEFVCHGPGADPTKGVWQVSNHWSYAIPTITDVVNVTQGVTNTQNDPGTSYGDTGLQADITVLKADSGIKVSVSFPWQDAAGNETLVFRVTRSGVDVTGDIKVGFALTVNTVSMASLTFIDGVGATGGHTYKLQAKCTAGGGAVHLFAAGATVFGIGAIVLQEMKNS